MSGDAKRKENSTIKTKIIMLVLQVTGKYKSYGRYMCGIAKFNYFNNEV